MDEETVRSVLSEANKDTAAAERRTDLCRALAKAFRETGDHLWIGGYLLGPDRVSKSSPFDFGSDAAVGLATVIQIGGELMSGAVTLLEQENLYATAALIRQLVEVEYLTWAFAEDHEQAKAWLRSSREERLKFWQPRDLRRRSGDRFRSADYAQHCERGGHPTPEALALLPDHARRDPAMLWWFDLAIHSTNTWDYLNAAATKFRWSKEVDSIASRHGLAPSIREWRQREPLLVLLKH